MSYVYDMYMSQLNLHLKPDFERDLARFMKLRGLSTKSEAVRVAVREGLERALRAGGSATDFRKLVGTGLRAAVNPQPRFESDDDLWSRT